MKLFIFALAPATSTSAFAEIRPENCARAAKYFEQTRGVSMLVMQNGRWPIFSGTKNFWGIAALCTVRDGLIKLDDHVADTITEWKNDRANHRSPTASRSPAPTSKRCAA
jgi:hypothetical protein